MANWLLDYIEMTEYIPPEFRDQTFTMRELDLKVSIAMSQLENDIREFFSKIDSMSPKEKQEHYDELLKKCDEAAMVANTKVKIADRLHDLVEKSMRLLDQGLEKLKEDLIEGDKAYIVEDIERRSQELDEQLHLQEESMMQRQHKIRDSKATTNHNYHNHHHHHHSKGSHTNNTSNHRLSNHHSTHNNHHSTQISHHKNHHNHHPNNNNNHHHHNSHHHHYHHNRHRNNSTSGHNTTATSTISSASGVKHKKRERKRFNSAMTIFNRNSKTEDDPTDQTNFLSSPTTPDYLANLHSSNSNSLNDVSGGDTNCLTLKGMAGNKGMIGTNDKSNGTDPLAKARQPILTAIDAAHAVSPNATNSDKLVLFSNNSNGDNYNNSNYMKDKQTFNQNQMSQLSNLISPPGFMNSNYNPATINGNNKSTKGDHNHSNRALSTTSSPFASLSRHDPIMMAASQAIHATQSMTPGRRTSSLKASYAAVNSGRLQHPNHSNHSMFDQANLTGEVYCKCRGTVHDPNMIACDNVNCRIEWFHYECVGITTPPAGEWYCDDCKGLPRSVQEQAANTSKHQQSRQTANNLLQTADTIQRGELNR
jgi:hypothetical protein